MTDDASGKKYNGKLKIRGEIGDYWLVHRTMHGAFVREHGPYMTRFEAIYTGCHLALEANLEFKDSHP